MKKIFIGIFLLSISVVLIAANWNLLSPSGTNSWEDDNFFVDDTIFIGNSTYYFFKTTGQGGVLVDSTYFANNIGAANSFTTTVDTVENQKDFLKSLIVWADSIMGVGIATPSEELEVHKNTFSEILISSDRNSASDETGRIGFEAENSSSAEKKYAGIKHAIVNSTAGSEEGSLEFELINSGILSTEMTLTKFGLDIEDKLSADSVVGLVILRNDSTLEQIIGVVAVEMGDSLTLYVTPNQLTDSLDILRNDIAGFDTSQFTVDTDTTINKNNYLKTTVLRATDTVLIGTATAKLWSSGDTTKTVNIDAESVSIDGVKVDTSQWLVSGNTLSAKKGVVEFDTANTFIVDDQINFANSGSISSQRWASPSTSEIYMYSNGVSLEPNNIPAFIVRTGDFLAQNQARIQNEVASATNPVFCPTGAINTGVGGYNVTGTDNDYTSIIHNSVEKVRVAKDTTYIYNTLKLSDNVRVDEDNFLLSSNGTMNGQHSSIYFEKLSNYSNIFIEGESSTSTDYAFIDVLGNTSDGSYVSIGAYGAVNDVFVDVRTDSFYYSMNNVNKFTISNFITYIRNSLELSNGDIFIQSDSKKVYFGAGDDASMYYNGSGLFINPQEVGSGDIHIEAGDFFVDAGDIDISGDAMILGKITCDSIFTTKAGAWADYVFNDRYNLKDLDKYISQIKKEKHLESLKPEEGNDKVSFQEIQLRLEGTVEELEKSYLYIGQLNERIKILENNSGITSNLYKNNIYYILAISILVLFNIFVLFKKK